MKKIIKNLSGLVLVAILFFVTNSCQDTSYIKHTYTANVPTQYMSFDELRSAVKQEAPQPLKDPGKIYFKNNYIFISERYKGIHIIDNSDPANPVNKYYLNIPGNVDIAIRGNVLYADSYTDLVALDISNFDNITVLKRVENAFDYPLFNIDPDYPVSNFDRTLGIVTAWEVKQITEKVEADLYYNGGMNKNLVFFGASMDAASSEGGLRFSTNNPGIAGSLASFMIYKNYLYVIQNWYIDIYDIADKANPQLTTDNLATGRNIETLFVDNENNRLFIGSTTGMLIYDLSSPTNPQYISEFTHATSCDPVVVQGHYAYVTMRSGTACGGWTDQLDVIDLSNITNPLLVNSFVLENPYGLGIDDNVLFVCDGTAGLKVFNNAKAPATMNQLYTFPDIHAFDVIIPYAGSPMSNKILFMIGSDGLYQYDYNYLDNITLLSFIPIEG